MGWWSDIDIALSGERFSFVPCSDGISARCPFDDRGLCGYTFSRGWSVLMIATPHYVITEAFA